MTQHTPTPWVYQSKRHDDWGWIRDANGDLAAIARDGRVASGEHDDYRRTGKDPYGANAALIVKAVNCHDALVNALSLLEKAEEFHVNCEECNGEDIPENCEKCFPHYDDARTARRTALALTQGSSK